MERSMVKPILLGLLAFAAILLVVTTTGCANLERDVYVEPDAPVSTPDGKPPAEIFPDAAVPDAPPVCTPEPPKSCYCDDDCGPGAKCKYGKCYTKCECDDDCACGYECKYGYCKPE